MHPRQMTTEQRKNMRATLDAAAKQLAGRRIEAVRYMSQPEVEAFGWSHRPLELLLDDGSTLYATADEEMNEAGVIILKRAKDEVCFGRY